MTTQQPLGEIAEIVRGISFPKEAKSLEPRGGDIACLRTTNVQRVVEWDDLWFVPSEHVKRAEQFVQSGDILISTANSFELVGKVALVSAVPRRATLGAFISLIRARPGVDPRFLYHQLAWGHTQSRIRETASTTTNISNVSTKKLAALELNVPPLDDQRRIVAELEKQFSCLDEAVVNLKRAKAKLRNLRASALNTACEGPWPSIGFGLLARETLVGLDRRRDQQRSLGRGHRYVKMNNVSMDGEIQPEGIVYVDASSQEATRYALRSGDILFNTRNSVELVGKSALVPPALEGALYNNNLMRIRTTPEIDPAFLAMQMCAPALRRQLEKVKRATTSVAAIYLKDLVRVPVIVPPVSEQHRILAEVDRRLSIIREVEAEVNANLKRAQALRHAVLGRAFSGNEHES